MSASRPLLSPDDLAFLDQARVARLATSDAAGRPFVVPVCFARVGERLYVPVDAKPKRGDPRRLRRLRNLRARPTAALLVDHYDEDWAQLRWLVVHARAMILETVSDGGADDERRQGLTALERRYPQYLTTGLAALDLPLIALEPVAVGRWRASDDSATRSTP